MPVKKISRREFLKFSGNLFGGLTLTGLLGWRYMRFEPKWVEYSQIRLIIPNLPPTFDGFKIAHLTDTHFDEVITPQHVAGIVEKVNTFEPDLIAFTGDLIDSRTPHDYDPMICSLLDDLEAKEMVCAVPGNHDHWEGIDRFLKIMEDSKVEVLDNKVKVIEREGQSLYSCGVDSHMVGLADLSAVIPELPEGGCAILLAHEPDFADISKTIDQFVLQLSGHTHGGLVNVPFKGPPVLPNHGKKYPQGLYELNGMYQYTSRGIGTGKYHLRFNCRPEVALITLLRSNQE